MLLMPVLFCLLWSSAALSAGKLTLNMKNADIEALITTVAEMTGRNFIVDPRVKGKVTVISSKPLDEEEIYQVFLSILEVHGFSAVPSGDNIVKIIPHVEAKQAGIPEEPGGRPSLHGAEIVTRIVHVEYVNATQLVPILRPLIPQQGHLAAFPITNVLIISDTASNVDRIVRLIQRMDRASTDEIEIITLENASAAEVVRILNLLIQGDQKGAKAAPASQINVVADERTNSILLGGEKSQRLRLRAIISRLDTPTESGGNTQVFYLKHAEAKDLAPILTQIAAGAVFAGKQPVKGAQSAAANGGGEVTILADEGTNALIITAPPDQMAALRSVIEQLDIRRRQVLIEAVIAEVSGEKSAELGIQWRTSVTPSGTAAASVFPDSGSITGNLGSLLSGLSVGFFRHGDLRVLIRALAGDNDTNILSTPSLVTVDNKEAEIIVGQNVPFITGSFTTPGTVSESGNLPFQTIERQDVGLKLKVKPLINEGDTVKLDVEQEVSTISRTSEVTGSTGNDTNGDNGSATATSQTPSDIVTNKRFIKTTVLVDDGSIVVLGGLIENNLQQGVDKVPGLGDLPLIGNLFKSREVTNKKTNLMVFLRPLILRDSASSEQAAGRNYDLIRGKQQDIRKKGVVILPDETSPLMPAFDEYLELPPTFEATQQNSPASAPPAGSDMNPVNEPRE